VTRFDLTPYLDEPVEIVIRGETFLFPSELDIPDLLRAYELNRKLREATKAGEDLDANDMDALEAAEDAEMKQVDEVHGFLLGLARRERPETKRIPLPSSKIGRLFSALISGTLDAPDAEAAILALLTGKTAEEIEERQKTDGADPTKPKAKASAGRSRKRSSAASTV
jgi:hypothetical protein